MTHESAEPLKIRNKFSVMRPVHQLMYFKDKVRHEHKYAYKAYCHALRKYKTKVRTYPESHET